MATDFASRTLLLPGTQLPPVVPALATTLILMALAPVGYIGGGLDDSHYLEAARCAAEHGFCLPEDHWGRRFPLVIPAGFTLALFGESRQTLWIVPLIYSLAAVTLFTATVQRTFGRHPALIAGFLFAAMPVFSERILYFRIDIAEFAFLAAAAFCLRLAVESRTTSSSALTWTALSGLAVSLAVLTRPTSLGMLPVFAAAFVLCGQKRQLLPFGIAFAAPLLVEALYYWLASGDPLMSWRLSLAHTTIPTTELPAGVDLSASPLFNVNFIDGWRPISGIEFHWTLDGFLNLLANSTMIVLPIAIVMLAFHHRFLGRPEAGGRALLLLIGAAIFYFGVLVYGFAIDPKPRMFLPVAAIACATCGVLGALSWQKGQRLIVLAMIIVIGVVASVSAVARVNGDPLQAAFGPLQT